MSPHEEPSRPGLASEDPTILPGAGPVSTPRTLPTRHPDRLGEYRILGVLGRLQHPGIAQVFEVGVHDDESEAARWRGSAGPISP